MKSEPDASAIRAPAANGEMAALIRAKDWSSTPLGPVESWPHCLKLAVEICLNSRFPMFVWWGPDLVNLYNDAYAPILGKRHPVALGESARVTWADIWPVLRPQVEGVMLRGEASWNDRTPLTMERNGYSEQTFFTWSYSPISDGTGGIGGLFCVCIEDTERVRAEERVTRVLESITDGFFTLDDGWRFIYVNAEAEQILGVTREQLLGSTLWAEFPGVAGTFLEREYRRAVREKVAVEVEHFYEPWARTFLIKCFPTAEGGLSVYFRDISQKRLAEQRLELAVAAAELGTWEWLPENDGIQLSDRAARIFGLAPGIEITRSAMRDLLDGAHRELAASANARAIAEKSDYDIEYRVNRPDGRRVWVAARGRGQYDESGKLTRMLGVVQDVTARKRADEERERLLLLLDAERSKLSAVIEQSPAFICVLKGPTHVFEIANAGYYQLVGRRELVGRPVREALPEVEGQGFFEILDQVYRTGEPVKGSEMPAFVRRREDGPLDRVFINVTWQPVHDADGAVSGVFVHGVDVTDLVRARLAAQESEERFRAAFDQSTVGVVLTDLQGRFVRANDAFCRMVGRGADELTGQDSAQYTHPDDRRLNAQSVGRIEGEDSPSVRFEKRYIRPDGRTIWAQATLSPLRYRDGAPNQIVAVVEDITERKLREMRDAFLSGLDDQVRPLDDPDAITATAARLLGEHLQADRCAYADVEADQDTFNLTGDYNRDVPSIVGRYTFSQFGQTCLRLMRADLPYVVEDIETHQPPPEDIAAYHQTLIRAVVCVPLHKSGRFVAAMAVHQKTPRKWSDEEISLVGTVAARCQESIERARVMRELRTSEANFRELADAMPQIVFAARPDGHVDYYNRQWYEYTGLPNVGKTGESSWASVLEPDNLPNVRTIWGEATRSGTSYEIEYPLRRHDGAWRWHLGRALPIRDAAGRVVRWFGTNTDIHDQKTAEDALRRSEARLNDIVRTAIDCIIGIDREGRVTEWNPAAESTFGYRRDEAMARDVVALISPPASREARQGGLQKSLAAGMHEVLGRRIEITAMHRDGTEFPVELSITPLAMAHPPAYTAYLRDITERKRAEAERDALLASERAARNEAEHASRMKDEFLATLSHELRTPLNAILGWSQIIRRSTARPGDLAQGLDVIERNARVQTQIIEDLLDMSRIISGKVRLDVQRVDLASIVQSAVETTRPAAQAKGIRLQAILDPLNGVVVSGDANRLQQILWNLLSNSVKFTPRDGKIQVLLERVNSHLEITVVDTGEGISASFLPFVFDRFRQADASTTRRHGGIGLGLSIVKQLVELHGGSIRARSAGEGQGATFVVSLPLTVVHPDPHPAPQRRHPTVVGVDTKLPDMCVKIGGVRVLMVDDEPDARALIRRLLEDCDATVTTAGSAEEAVRLVQEKTFDVLISDIGMPDEDGYAVIRRVRALGPEYNARQLPAVALTAYARAEDRVKSVIAGFQMHIAKPVEPTELLAVVANLAGRTDNA